METKQEICSNCSTPLPIKGYFCGGCLSQFKCKECDSPLENDYVGCINCGAPKIQQSKSSSSNQNANTFRLHETLNDRTIEATFSDTVGKDLSNILRDAYMSKRGMQNSNLLGNTSTNAGNNQAQQINEDIHDAEIVSTNIRSSSNASHSPLSNASPQQYPTLKAIAMKNLPASETEWITVYAFYASSFGEETFTRDNIIEQYKESNRFDKATTRRDLSTNIKRAVQAEFINPLTTGFSLLDAGIEKAIEIINRTSSSAPRQRTSVKNKKENSTTESKSSQAKKATNAVKGLKRLTDIDFEPTGKESLESFFAKYSPKNDNERNLLFVTYLQSTLGINEISFNHVYTCYDTLDMKVSENLPQTLRNTASRTGWLEIKSSKISTTIKGK